MWVTFYWERKGILVNHMIQALPVYHPGAHFSQIDLKTKQICGTKAGQCQNASAVILLSSILEKKRFVLCNLRLNKPNITFDLFFFIILFIFKCWWMTSIWKLFNPIFSWVLGVIKTASQLLALQVSSTLWGGLAFLCYNDIRQVFTVPICTVNTQGQHSIGISSIQKNKKETGSYAAPRHLGRGVRMQWSVMESFIQIPWGLAVEAKLSLGSALIFSWNTSLYIP